MSKTVEANFPKITHDGDWTIQAPNVTTLPMSPLVTVILADHEAHLLRWLSRQEAVVGCVAWLTNERILQALNVKEFLSIVMQKEDWLRPDYDGAHPAAQRPELYAGDSGLTRFWFDSLRGLSYCDDPSIPRYRVFGIAGEERGRPVMHHKFLIGGSLLPWSPGEQAERNPFLPASVWAGSWNMTRGSRRNLDSALILGADVAAIYYREWLDVLSHSEPLDFRATYAEPEWRVGS